MTNSKFQSLNPRAEKMCAYGRLFAGALVHPDHKVVFPFAPEMIQIQDGETKNDCEREASKQFITDFRREHPHLKTIVVEDALASNGPHIKHLKAHRLGFILGAKAGDHKALFERVATDLNTRSLTQTTPTNTGTITHDYRWLYDVPLNDSHPDLKVNVLHDTENKPDQRPTNWTWVTNLSRQEDHLYDVMRAARARWKIEHETFKILKIDGNHFAHNFGYGNDYLAGIMVFLCLLAFLIDQVVEHSCGMFRQARKKTETKTLSPRCHDGSFQNLPD